MNIDQLIDGVIGREGGYSDHPADRGGPTRWGVTEQSARAYGYAGDMKVFPREKAVAIYRDRYWVAPAFDRLAGDCPTLAAELFDAGVNMGTAIAAKFLQRTLNLLNRGASDYPDLVVDGRIGAMTLSALAGYRKVRGDPEGLAAMLWMVRAFRTARYAEIAEASPSQEVFEYGWIARQVRAA